MSKDFHGIQQVMDLVDRENKIGKTKGKVS